MAGIYYRKDDSFAKIDLFLYSTEDLPPPGHTVHASAAFWGKISAFAKVVQAILNEDTRLLSEDVWHIATRDDLRPRGLKVPSPELSYTNPFISST